MSSRASKSNKRKRIGKAAASRRFRAISEFIRFPSDRQAVIFIESDILSRCVRAPRVSL